MAPTLDFYYVKTTSLMIKESNQQKRSKKRVALWSLAILIVVFVVLIITTKAYLYVNVLLGNDLIVKTAADKENVFLKRGESANVSIKTSVATNPFCSTECNYEIFDISGNKSVETGSFVITVPKPDEKQLTLAAVKKGEGQELYRFEVTCISPETVLCHTTQEPVSGTILFTLNYEPSDRERIIKNTTRDALENGLASLAEAQSVLLQLEASMSQMNYWDVADLKQDVMKTRLSLVEFKRTLYNSKNLWENEEYLGLEQNSAQLIRQQADLEKNLNQLNESFMKNLSEYNELVFSLLNSRALLLQLTNQNLTNATAEKINKSANDFNFLIHELNQTTLKENKREINLLERTIESNVREAEFEAEQNLTKEIILNYSLEPFDQKPITFTLQTNSSVDKLIEPLPQCCLFGKCGPCCDSSCSSNISQYPVIFLHGHDFNSGISAEYSLGTFTEIQKKLESEGYLDAGAITISKPENSLYGIWGKTTGPISVRTSYYFDIYRKEEKTTIIETKTDNLDTYAVRLKDVIDTVKFKTGRTKVIIVAHSMGGLVTRRYVQIFGASDVEKIVLIGTPNHGISGSVEKLCSVFGSERHCGDMAKESLFLNKLNSEGSPVVPTTNIIGTGCDTSGFDGDGIVTNESTYLQGADNKYISGTCGSFIYLHNEILKPEKYPQVFEYVKEALKT